MRLLRAVAPGGTEICTPVPPLPSTTLSATETLADTVLTVGATSSPKSLSYSSTRFRAALAMPVPPGTILIPMKLLAITVFEMASWLEELGWNTIALPVVPTAACDRLRMTQFSMVKNLPLLNTIPLPLPKPMPLMVIPRRLTVSVAPAEMVTPVKQLEYSMRASPTTSLMMLMVLLIVTAP